MKKLLALLFVFAMVLGGSQNAGAQNIRARNCVGPITATAASTYYPSARGFDVSHLDGDMSFFQWWKGSGALSIEAQVSGFTALEDPTNLTFTTVLTRGAANFTDSAVGPVQRVRWYTATCTGDCTVALKACGRVAP